MKLANLGVDDGERLAVVDGETARLLPTGVDAIEMLSLDPAEREARAATATETVPLAEAKLLAPLHPPAVRAHDVLDDREAEPGAFALAREAIVQAVEFLEDALVLGLRNAGAVVRDGDTDVLEIGGVRHLDVRRVATVLVGVGQQVEHCVRHGAAVCADEEGLRR